MSILTQISVPEGTVWTLISDNNNISLFDNTPDNTPDVSSEVVMEPSNENYEKVRTESEKVISEGRGTNKIMVLSFENTFLASDVYLQERVFTNEKSDRFAEPHAFIAKLEDKSFKVLAEAGMMRHLELLFVSLIAGDLREKHNYVVSNAVDAKYHKDGNSVELVSPDEVFKPIFVDAYQARLILDKMP